MPAITTHVLDTAKGKPAVGIPIRLEMRESARWKVIAEGQTDGDGRLRVMENLTHANYRLTFDVANHLGSDAFYPEESIHFAVRDDRHHHVPLLLSPFGYSTYRGS